MWPSLNCLVRFSLSLFVAQDDRPVGDGARRLGPPVECRAVTAVLAGLVGGLVAEVVDNDAVGGEGGERDKDDGDDKRQARR